MTKPSSFFHSLTVRGGAKAVVFAALFVGALTSAGCKKKAVETEAPAASAAPAAPAMTFAVGDAVDVQWKSSWWKGEILEVKGSKYRVHYVGWSSTWNEDVTPDRVRARSVSASVGSEETAPAASAAPSATQAAAEPAPKAVAATAWKAGSKVDVNWNGQWWQGQVLSVVGAQYKVHYVGWASSWDEVVPASRLRAPTGSAKRGSGA